MKPGAAIINISSVVAYEPSENIIDYAASKGAIMVFAKRPAPKGIRVNAVAPGPFWTLLQVTGGQPTDKLPSFARDTPIGRPGQPVELAGIYVLLASPESNYSMGQVYGAVGDGAVRKTRFLRPSSLILIPGTALVNRRNIWQA